jgi:hypothetical protein
MGQHHHQEIAAGSALVKRMILVLAVAVLMVAMMAAMAAPAFAKGPGTNDCIERIFNLGESHKVAAQICRRVS